MALLVLLGVSVDQAVDTSGTKRSSCNALALLASPWSLDLAGTEGLDSTSNDGGFGGLLPLLRLAATTAAAARPRVITAVPAVVVAVVATVMVAVATFL